MATDEHYFAPFKRSIAEGQKMTGEEFKRLAELHGTQLSVARALGVEADTVRARYRDEVVPKLYENAIIGLVLRTRLSAFVETADSVAQRVRLIADIAV